MNSHQEVLGNRCPVHLTQKSSNNKNVCSHSLSLYCYVSLFFPCVVTLWLLYFYLVLVWFKELLIGTQALCQVALTIDYDFFQQLQSKSYESSEGLQDSWREGLTSGEVRLLLGNFWGTSGLYPLSIGVSGRFGSSHSLPDDMPKVSRSVWGIPGECSDVCRCLLHDPGRMDFLELFSPKRGITCRSGI